MPAASSSEELLISKASLQGLPPASAAVGGMRRFFDISVPRNIGSDVNELGDDAHVYNIDDLKEVMHLSALFAVIHLMSTPRAHRSQRLELRCG